MDSVLWTRFRLILASALCAGAAGLHAQSMPSVTPVASVPQGAAPGGGVISRVTYQLGPAANSIPGEAANAASYLSRPVAISGPTMGGIVRGVVKGGLRLSGWVGAAMLAYEAYQWYTDANGQLTSPSVSVPSTSCGPGQAFFSFGNSAGGGCTVPAAMAAMRKILVDYYTSLGNTGVTITGDGCVPSGAGQTCAFSYQRSMKDRFGQQSNATVNDVVAWSNLTTTHVDPPYSTNPSPVTDTQLGDLAQQHPEWWPDMLRDPLTGQPLITPEIADDMNALRHQIAPNYGVDPTTLTDVQPDPEYLDGKAVPREQAIPEFCQWASAACNYFKFAEENWPDKQVDKQVTDSADCVTPPSCSGDEVMCAVLRTTWAGKCSTAGDPSVTRPVFGEHVVSELDQPDVDVGDVSQLDQTGFGWGGSCPFTDLGIDFWGQHVGVSVSAVCEYGPWMRAFILILAGLKCAEIMAGLRVAAE